MIVPMCVATVSQFCINNAITSGKILLAVSGGSDSVALVYIFTQLQKRLGITGIGIAHVNHGLRGDESDSEALFVARLAESAGLQFHCKRLNGKTLYDAGVEAWARKQRYSFMKALKERYGYRFIVTGHTADDQAETFLMNVERGCGLSGLCGIPAVRNDGIIRPLLAVRKITLQNWLKKQGYTWCEDRSNDDIRYTRNRVRHLIIPRLEKQCPDAVEKIVALTGYFRRQKEFLNPLVNKWITDNVIEGERNCFIVKKTQDKLDTILTAEGVSRLFRKHGIAFERKHIYVFLREMKRASGCFLLKDGWKYYPGKNSVEVVFTGDERKTKKNKLPAEEIRIPGTTVSRDLRCRLTAVINAIGRVDCTFDTTNRTAFLDVDKCGLPLLIRPVKKGDTFQPLGGGRPVDCIRFIKNQKVSRYYRRTMGVVVNQSGTIVWIPGVAVGNEYRVTPDTKSVLQISCHRIP